MKVRQIDIEYLIGKYIEACKGGLKISLEKLEVHMLSGGDIDTVIRALISAERSRVKLDFQRAAAIDLAGRNVSEAVRMCVQPKVLKLNNIKGVSKDGVELVVKASLTIKANIDTMVGGAGEDTILARVCQQIVSCIGSANTHAVVLNNPSMLSQQVLQSGLDSGTAFQIVSLDIADIDVGRNIGAYLQQLKAIADKKVAEAKASGRLAMAKAQMQENRAAEQEAKANLIAAEMNVPLTLAESFRKGKLISKRKHGKGNSNVEIPVQIQKAQENVQLLKKQIEEQKALPQPPQEIQIQQTYEEKVEIKDQVNPPLTKQVNISSQQPTPLKDILGNNQKQPQSEPQQQVTQQKQHVSLKDILANSQKQPQQPQQQLTKEQLAKIQLNRQLAQKMAQQKANQQPVQQKQPVQTPTIPKQEPQAQQEQPRKTNIPLIYQQRNVPRRTIEK